MKAISFPPEQQCVDAKEECGASDRADVVRVADAVEERDNDRLWPTQPASNVLVAQLGHCQRRAFQHNALMLQVDRRTRLARLIQRGDILPVVRCCRPVMIARSSIASVSFECRFSAQAEATPRFSPTALKESRVTQIRFA